MLVPFDGNTCMTYVAQIMMQPDSHDAEGEMEFGRVKMGIGPVATPGRTKKESKEKLLAKVLFTLGHPLGSSYEDVMCANSVHNLRILVFWHTIRTVYMLKAQVVDISVSMYRQ